MKYDWKPNLKMRLGLTCLLLILMGSAAVKAQECKQGHVGKQHRYESVLKNGDSRMAYSAAGHATIYAIQRYNLEDLVSEADKTKAMTETYEFLKWKLGNPTFIAAQFVEAGYQHFDKGYSDEAGAALIGFKLPSERGGHSMFYLTPELVDLWVLTEKLQNRGKAHLLQTFFGIPSALSTKILDAIVEQEAKALKRLGFNIPKSYDFPNGLVEAAVKARRNPEATRKAFLKAVEQAAEFEKNPSTPKPVSAGVKTPL